MGDASVPSLPPSHPRPYDCDDLPQKTFLAVALASSFDCMSRLLIISPSEEKIVIALSLMIYFINARTLRPILCNIHSERKWRLLTFSPGGNNICQFTMASILKRAVGESGSTANYSHIDYRLMSANSCSSWHRATVKFVRERKQFLLFMALPTMRLMIAG
jgi:hypothetical protein